jgi:hypothetical protein
MNLAGVEIALEMEAEVERMRAKLERMRRHAAELEGRISGKGL